MATINQLMNLEGRSALVTGATGNIGWKMVETIAELGGSLILVDRPGSDFEPLQEMIADINNVDVKSYECDLEIDGDRLELINAVMQLESGLDILINNAAFVGSADLSGWTTDFEEQSVATWRRAFEVNLTAVFDISKGLTTKLKKSGNGVIINMSSIYGVCGPDYSLYEETTMGNPAAYAASKGGLIQLTRWLATTLAPDVRVNTISPGGVFRNQPDVFIKRYIEKTPLKRMAIEDDIKGGVAYLASDLSRYVTGQNLLIDGGWTVI